MEVQRVDVNLMDAGDRQEGGHRSHVPFQVHQDLIRTLARVDDVQQLVFRGDLKER